MKKTFIACYLILMMSGCNTEAAVSFNPDEIREKTAFKVWIPTYIPDNFKVASISVDEDYFGVEFVNNKKFIDILEKRRGYGDTTQRTLIKYLQTHINREDLLYEVMEISKFTGLIDISLRNNGVYSYLFLPSNTELSIESSYKLMTNLDEKKFIKVLESLK